MREAISTGPTIRPPLILFGGDLADVDRDPGPRDFSGRLERLNSRLAELVAELERGREETRFWLFVSSSAGYSLVEQRGGHPKRGDLVRLDGAEYRVALVADWSFLDGRRCAYLEPEAIATHPSVAAPEAQAA